MGLNSTILNAFASVARLEAVEPEASRQRSLHVNGEHTPITEARVRKVLGDEAAAAWVGLTASVAAFDEAVDRATQGEGR